jgi:hypothetical protein
MEDAGFGILGKREREQQSEFAIPAPRGQKALATNEEEKEKIMPVHKALKYKKTGPIDAYFKPKQQKLDDD